MAKLIGLQADEMREQLENCGNAGLQPDRKLRNVGLWLDQNTKNMVEMARVSVDFGCFGRQMRGQNATISPRFEIWESRQLSLGSSKRMSIGPEPTSAQPAPCSGNTE